MEKQENIKWSAGALLYRILPVSKGVEDTDVLKTSGFLRSVVVYISVPVILFLSYNLLFKSGPYIQNSIVKMMPGIIADSFDIKNKQAPVTITFIEQNRINRIEKAYEKFSGTQAYLIVNTTENKFSLKNRKKIVRQGKCSTGSFILLDAGDQKKWKFETPKGLFRIQGKAESPVWNKPDWAFIEEGLPVPPSYSHLRWEAGVLGDYALSIGDGYLIHGTLYKRLLGMPVTHGCVRMDDEDLEIVFNTLNIGSRVYIF